MNRRSRRAVVLCAVSLALGLAACNRQEEGPGEKTGKAIDDAMRESAEQMNQAGQKMGEAMQKAGQEMGKAAEDMGRSMQDAAKRMQTPGQ